jgi:acyl-CoA-binding protein
MYNDKQQRAQHFQQKMNALKNMTRNRSNYCILPLYTLYIQFPRETHLNIFYI